MRETRFQLWRAISSMRESQRVTVGLMVAASLMLGLAIWRDKSLTAVFFLVLWVFGFKRLKGLSPRAARLTEMATIATSYGFSIMLFLSNDFVGGFTWFICSIGVASAISNEASNKAIESIIDIYMVILTAIGVFSIILAWHTGNPIQIFLMLLVFTVAVIMSSLSYQQRHHRRLEGERHAEMPARNTQSAEAHKLNVAEGSTQPPDSPLISSTSQPEPAESELSSKISPVSNPSASAQTRLEEHARPVPDSSPAIPDPVVEVTHENTERPNTPGASPSKDKPVPIKEFILALPSGERYLFRDEREAWTISGSGKMFSLRDIRGLGYIAYLLQNPDTPITPSKLWNIIEKNAVPTDMDQTPITNEDALNEMGLRLANFPVRQDILDKTAMANYQSRLAEIRDEKASAEQREAWDEFGQLENEEERILADLRASIDVHGKSRQFVDSNERARQTVQKAIKKAIVKISRKDAVLGEYLKNTIRTGYTCVYEPHLTQKLRSNSRLAP